MIKSNLPGRWIEKKRTTALSRFILSVEDIECTHEHNNRELTFSVVRLPDWVNIVPVTTDGDILFIRQHRLGTNSITLEVPAGIIEKGEDPLRAAERELREETGFHSSKIIPIGRCDANPAIQTNAIHFYAALDCKYAGVQNLDEGEDICVERIPRNKIKSMIIDGTINHSIIVSALSLFLLADFEKK